MNKKDRETPQRVHKKYRSVERYERWILFAGILVVLLIVAAGKVYIAKRQAEPVIEVSASMAPAGVIGSGESSAGSGGIDPMGERGEVWANETVEQKLE